MWEEAEEEEEEKAWCGGGDAPLPSAHGSCCLAGVRARGCSSCCRGGAALWEVLEAWFCPPALPPPESAVCSVERIC